MSFCSVTKVSEVSQEKSEELPEVVKYLSASGIKILDKSGQKGIDISVEPCADQGLAPGQDYLSHATPSQRPRAPPHARRCAS